MNGGETATNILLAVEQFADSLLDSGFSVDRVTNLLLRSRLPYRWSASPWACRFDTST